MTQDVQIRPRAPQARARQPERTAARRDPPPRSVEGMREGRLNFTPDCPISHKTHHFVLVNKADQRQGPGYYEDLGYDYVRPSDGVAIAGRARSSVDPSAPIEKTGHVLMACPRERFNEILQYGAGGDGGSQRADDIEKVFVGKKDLGRDTLRGLGVKPAHMRVASWDQDAGEENE